MSFGSCNSMASVPGGRGEYMSRSCGSERGSEVIPAVGGGGRGGGRGSGRGRGRGRVMAGSCSVTAEASLTAPALLVVSNTNMSIGRIMLIVFLCIGIDIDIDMSTHIVWVGLAWSFICFWCASLSVGAGVACGRSLRAFAILSFLNHSRKDSASAPRCPRSRTG